MSTLFTAVSVEQQEIVAGGAPGQAINITGFSSALNLYALKTTSTPLGSTAESAGVSDKKFTLGLSAITLDTNQLPGFPVVNIPVL